MSVQPVSFFSGALYARKTCYVYVPPSYRTDEERRYPVVYLLHGMYGGETDWWLRGGAEQTIKRMIAQGQLRECIVVMPNDGGYGQGTFYVDWYDGTGNFEQYIIDDLVPYIDGAFRTVASAEGRFVGGYSMGGFGAFSLALRHPDRFGAAMSLSGGLGAIGQLPYKQYARSEWARMIGPQHGAYAREYDLAVLAARCQQNGTMPALYMNCGTEDSLYPLNEQYEAYLRSIGYPHTYERFPGEHAWEYCVKHLADALLFLERHLAAADTKAVVGQQKR